MQRDKIYRVPVFLSLQFLISFFIVSYVVAGLSTYSEQSVSILIGCGIGLLLTANLSLGSFALQVVLDRLAHGLPVELVALRRYWPLHTLFQLVRELEQQYGRQSGQQTQVEQQTVEYKDQLMLQVIAATAQEERNRLARDLHDSIKQQIFSITMSAAAAKARWEHDLTRVRSILDDIERTAREAQVEMQAMLQQLRPHALENTGLVESLRMQSQALEYRTGASVLVEIGQLPSEEQLPPGLQEVLFRIVQEGFANIARHARASHVWLSLYQQEEFLLLEIGDDGQGFDISHKPGNSGSGGMGMQNIHERMQAFHGTVQVWSMPDQGTTLQIAIPLLVSSEFVFDAEQEEPELTTTKKARLILNVGLRLIDVAAVCILLYVPISIVPLWIGICLFGAGSIWLGAQIPRMQVALSVGRNQPQHLSLMVQSNKLLLSLLLLGAFYLGYIRYDWLSSWFIFIVIALVITLTVRYYVLHSRFLRLLTQKELQKLINKQQQQVGLDFLVWLITIGLAAFFGIITLDLYSLHFSSTMWAQNAVLSFYLLWFIVIMLKGIETLYWQQLLVKRSA